MSPMRITSRLPIFKMDLDKTGSSAGSISSKMSCKRMGEPYCTAFSTSRRNPVIFRSMMRNRVPSMLRIQRLAWPCGSIINGQRLPRVEMTPFSVEKSSLGRPWMFQSRTSVGLARNLAKSKPSVTGNFCVLTDPAHCFIIT